jgi:hypothetical protein
LPSRPAPLPLRRLRRVPGYENVTPLGRGGRVVPRKEIPRTADGKLDSSNSGSGAYNFIVLTSFGIFRSKADSGICRFILMFVNFTIM